MRDEHLIGVARQTRYADLAQNFRWNVPERFNFGRDVVDAWASENDGLALIWENATGETAQFRYSDMARLTNRLADALARAGLKKGDRVVVMLPRIPQWQIALVACTKLGAVAIPCIEMLTQRDIAYRVENSGAVAAICRAGEVDKFSSVIDRLPIRISVGSAHGWTPWDAALASGSDEFTAADVACEDPAIMYYTSGSTGHPKGVLHAARSLYAWRMSAFYWLDLGPDDRIWCTADTGWSKAGTSILWGPWSAGACSLFYDGPYVPAERLRLLAKHKVSVFCASSTELLRLAGENTSAYDLSALRRTVSAGEAVNPVAAERWHAATDCQVCEAYGQTEALMMILNYPSEPVAYGSMGFPQPGLEIDIVDDAGVRQGANVEGHVALKMPCPQMMLGYWRDEERTAATMVDGPDGRWYLSGDRGRRDGEGRFWYEGRADDVINSAGYRIGPLEVENVLLEHAAVQECAVVPSPNAERGEIVKAFVVLKPGFVGTDALAADLQNHVKAATAPYKYPRAIEFIAEIPKTVTGKIRRRSLKELELARARSAR